MSRKLITGVILCIVVGIGIYYIVFPLFNKNISHDTLTPIVQKISMKLTSPVFDSYQKIPVDYTCDGKKVHPPFIIAGVPSSAKSLALVVDDPDAPTGTFTHWVIWNIHPDVTTIKEGEVPNESQEGTNSIGETGYTPPCPPTGQHRYFFTLYALDAKLGLDGKATKEDVEKTIAGHVLAQFLLVGVYSR